MKTTVYRYSPYSQGVWRPSFNSTVYSKYFFDVTRRFQWSWTSKSESERTPDFEDDGFEIRKVLNVFTNTGTDWNYVVDKRRGRSDL